MQQLIRLRFVDYSKVRGTADRPMRQPALSQEACFEEADVFTARPRPEACASGGAFDNMKSRFEAIPDPGCRYEIWDNESGEPVVHRGRLLSFATAKSAARMADALNVAVEAAAGSRANFYWRSKGEGL